MLYVLTGFMYKGLTPHKFTPMTGVHNQVDYTARGSVFSTAMVYRKYLFVIKVSEALAVSHSGGMCKKL
jgi:hypothetical protein